VPPQDTVQYSPVQSSQSLVHKSALYSIPEPLSPKYYLLHYTAQYCSFVTAAFGVSTGECRGSGDEGGLPRATFVSVRSAGG